MNSSCRHLKKLSLSRMDASMTGGCVDTHMTDKGLGILLNTLKENSAINLAILELSGICLGSIHMRYRQWDYSKRNCWFGKSMQVGSLLRSKGSGPLQYACYLSLIGRKPIENPIGEKGMECLIQGFMGDETHQSTLSNMYTGCYHLEELRLYCMSYGWFVRGSMLSYYKIVVQLQFIVSSPSRIEEVIALQYDV